MSTFETFLILFAAFGQGAHAEPRVADGIRLQDFRGAPHALDDVRDRKLVVLVFLGVECLLAKQYAPRLVELARAFEPKGLAFFGIDANQQDGATAMGRFANANDLPFPFLWDVGNEPANRLKVERTPEVLVLDAKRSIRYRGRIDDQFDINVPRYEFDWQNAYILDEPKRMPEGTIMCCVGHFDNSADNPNNPDPTRIVAFGEQTNDEMLIGYMDVALDYQDLTVGPPKVAAREDGQFDVTFRHRPPEGVKTVHLAASFNNDYSPVQELDGPDTQGFFTTTVVVPGGRYKYKYVHDGQKYRHDPANWRQMGFFSDSELMVGKK